MAHLLSLIPEGEQYNTLRFILQRLEQDFPDKFAELENQADRITGWITEIDSGTGRDADQIRDDIVEHVIGEEAAIAKYGITSEQFQQLILGENEGGLKFGDLEALRDDAVLGTQRGALQGGRTIKTVVNGQDRYYQVYEFPPGSGNFISYQFNDFAQVEATFGPQPAFTVESENWFNTNVIAEADAEEIIGLDGTWQGLTDEIMRDAATAAGITDPTLLGLIASDPEIQEIMAQAIIGDWTPAQILAAQRQTTFWKEVLYPGIEAFYGKTTNPEQAYLNYTGSVTGALQQLGYEKDKDGTYNSIIKDMLDKNIDAETFLAQVPTFLLATQNEEFAAILSEWTLRDLGIEVGFQEWFDLLEGNSSTEVEQVAENARLAWVAQNQGTGVTNEEIRALAERTQLSLAEAAAAFSSINQAMLALGPKGLERGGLTRDDILATMAGVAPEGGRSIEEVRLQIAKLARENDLFDNEKINFFVGFDPLGKPNRPGLQVLTPEGA